MKTGIGLLLRLIAVGLCILALVLGARGLEARGLQGSDSRSPGSTLHPDREAVAPQGGGIREILSGVRPGSRLHSSTAANTSAAAALGQAGGEAAS